MAKKLIVTFTAEQYFAHYKDLAAEIPQEHRDHAEALVARVNPVLELAAADGVRVLHNPFTGSRIAGNKGGGGYRIDDHGGESNSKHKKGQAVDIYDPYRELADWCFKHRESVLGEASADLYMEDPRWTTTWVHLQIVAPGSGRRVFIPHSRPPFTGPVPSQVGYV